MARTAWVILWIGTGLLAGDPECARCGDKGEVTCPLCDGKKTPSLDCVDCDRGKADCRPCQGVGSMPCPACGGAGKVGDAKLKCLYCQKGRIKCRVCQEGHLKCTACKSSGTIKTKCPLCIGAGKLPCPDCEAYVAPASCTACAGKARETCSACEGKGELTRGCAACQGVGKVPCGQCKGQGKTHCFTCGGAGRLSKINRDGTIEATDECEACDDAGSQPCSPCEKKGVQTCEPCKGTGKEKVSCPYCQGWKSIDCRACTPAQGWTYEDANTGALYTMVPCSTYEPLVARGLSTSFGIPGMAVYRLFVDNRKGQGPVRLGSPDCVPAWTGGDGVTRAPFDTKQAIPPLLFARLDQAAPAWGADVRDFESSVEVEAGGVGSLFFLVGEDVSKGARVELRIGDSAVHPTAGPVERVAWARLRLATPRR